MRKVLKRILLIVSLVALSGSINVKGDVINNLSNPSTADNKSTWECIYFGNYYQSNAKLKEPIKWRILSISGSEAFLLSDKILDRYEVKNEYLGKVTWENSSLRNWLNTEFYNMAFSSDEKNSIIDTYLENKGFNWNKYSYVKDDSYVGEGGNSTYDKVFNLSVEEVNNKAYGFVSNDPDDNIFYSETRYSEATNYAGEREDNSWWLRTPGANNLPCVINESAPRWSYFTIGEYYGVRPAIRINLSNLNWTKADPVTLSHNYIEHKVNKNSQQESNIKQSTSSQVEKMSKNSSGDRITVSSTSIKNVKSKKKALKVTWKKVEGVNGYKIQYSLKKTFKKVKTKTVKKASKTSLTIKKLKSKKKYFIRIRTYKKVGGKLYQSKWSKPKSITTK